jgi:DNA-binding NarL/FixJ family response regulator
MIKLAIIDDDERFADTLKQELVGYENIEWIITRSSGLLFVSEFKKLAVAERPNVILMDISMGEADEGIKATKHLAPEVKIIMFTIGDDDEHVFEAFKSGALGYLLKNEKPDFIYKTLKDVYDGGAQMSPSIALKTIQFLSHQPTTKEIHKDGKQDFLLSERELEVLRLTARGLTYPTISERLFISTETVKKHMHNIFRKLHVKNKIEAINKAKDFI